MDFNYLNTATSPSSPFPPNQTATAYQDVASAVNGLGTYSLIIQGIATNGTV